MSSEDDQYSNTIHLIVRNESFELSSSLFRQLVEHSSSSDLNVPISDKQSEVYLNVDPCIFNTYLLYIQTGCFVRPDYLSQEDLIHGLRTCGASLTLINHYENDDLMSLLSSRHPLYQRKEIRQKWLNALILTGLFLAGCILAIDLYRQMLILSENPSQETSQLLMIMIYFTDSVLFLYTSLHGICKFRSSSGQYKRLMKDPNFLLDIISCLGILSYFIIQRPIGNIHSSHWNSLWIFSHLCRTIRIAQIGYRLIDIQWCLYAITECLGTFLKTIIALFWLFIFSGSILYTIDIMENNQQYPSIRLTILSAHETLYTIGYRNNAPYGRLARLWTILSIYFMSSLVQILLWWFQTRVMIKWNNLLSRDRQKQYEQVS